MKSFRPLFILLLITVSSSFGFGQQITNVQASLQGDNIIVTYNLISPDPEVRFEIKLYSSYNNFSAPVNLVTGDAGSNVAPGLGKRIVWNAKQELNTFTGNITFEVRGTPVAASQPQEEVTDPNQFRFTTPTAGDKFKMGSILNVRWTGGLSQDVKLELHKDNRMIQPLTSTQNTGSWNWNVPKEKTLKGSGYTIKLFNVNQPQSGVFSGAFNIKGKVSVAVYIIPAVVVVGGIVGILAAKNGGGGVDPDPITSNDLPTPPRPDGGG